jgi:S-methylmethionine-dependent homocysteine/selenocysteine methylase
MGGVRLTDGGLETSLIFRQGLDLPLFAAFPLVETRAGRAALRRYRLPSLELAAENRAGFVVDTATWRANRDWAARLGYDATSLRAANKAAVRFARELAAQIDHALVNGVVGPRGDGYVVDEVMSPEEAAEYHRPQVAALAEAGVDQVSAITFTYAEEAVGFVRSATSFGVPAIVSFTVETDGRLPSGQSLRDAVETVDDLTYHAPAGFMINCAHPMHFEHALVDGDWLYRLAGVRANASTMSHAELDAADELDDGDPVDLAVRYSDLGRRLPALQILGGCCGTDERHIRAISDVCVVSG